MHLIAHLFYQPEVSSAVVGFFSAVGSVVQVVAQGEPGAVRVPLLSNQAMMRGYSPQ